MKLTKQISAMLQKFIWNHGKIPTKIYVPLNLCSAEFIEKHDFDYMLNFLNEKIKQKYDIFIDFIIKILLELLE